MQVAAPLASVGRSSSLILCATSSTAAACPPVPVQRLAPVYGATMELKTSVFTVTFNFTSIRHVRSVLAARRVFL